MTRVRSGEGAEGVSYELKTEVETSGYQPRTPQPKTPSEQPVLQGLSSLAVQQAPVAAAPKPVEAPVKAAVASQPEKGLLARIFDALSALFKVV